MCSMIFTATIDATTYSDGDEIAAFVPTDLVAKIKELVDPGSHIYMVDGSAALLSEAQIKIV